MQVLPPNLLRTTLKLCPWAEFTHQCGLEGQRGNTRSFGGGGVVSGCPTAVGGSCTPCTLRLLEGPFSTTASSRPALPNWAFIPLKSAFPVPFLNHLSKNLQLVAIHRAVWKPTAAPELLALAITRGLLAFLPYLALRGNWGNWWNF